MQRRSAPAICIASSVWSINQRLGPIGTSSLAIPPHLLPSPAHGTMPNIADTTPIFSGECVNPFTFAHRPPMRFTPGLRTGHTNLRLSSSDTPLSGSPAINVNDLRLPGTEPLTRWPCGARPFVRVVAALGPSRQRRRGALDRAGRPPRGRRGVGVARKASPAPRRGATRSGFPRHAPAAELEQSGAEGQADAEAGGGLPLGALVVIDGGSNPLAEVHRVRSHGTPPRKLLLTVILSRRLPDGEPQ